MCDLMLIAVQLLSSLTTLLILSIICHLIGRVERGYMTFDVRSCARFLIVVDDRTICLMSPYTQKNTSQHK